MQRTGGTAQETVNQICLVFLIRANHESPMHVLQVHAESHAGLVLAAPEKQPIVTVKT